MKFLHILSGSAFSFLYMDAQQVNSIDYTDIVKMILSVLGGVISAIVLKYLACKFPQYFTPNKTTDQKQTTDEENNLKN